MSFDLHAAVSIVALSLLVSGSATICAAALGVPAGIVMAIQEFPGRRALVLAANLLLCLPPASVGVALFAALSWFGPSPLLRTPAAMALAQFLLAIPIVTALAHRAAARHWWIYRTELLLSGAGSLRRLRLIAAVGRAEFARAALLGFARTLSEVGAALIVGGNIAGVTRTMTAAIVFDANGGNLAEALILAALLIAASVAIAAAVFRLSPTRGTRV